MKLDRHIIVVSALIACLFIGACKKADEVSPYISISSPAEATLFNVFDTVHVSFEISDETNLQGATVELVNQNFVAVTPKVGIQNYIGSVELVINDKLLETGDYYVLITANDGSNEAREYRKIRIAAIPKARRGIYVATTNGTLQDNVWKVDSLMQHFQSMIQPGQDVLKLRVNSMFDKLTLAGNLSTGLKTYDLKSGTLDWSDNVFNVSHTERFEDLHYYESTVYVTIYDRELRGYTLSGALSLKLPTGSYRPELVYRIGTYLLVEMNLVGDDRHILNVYHATTNGLLWQQEFPMDIVSIAALQNDEVLVFGNDGNQARVFHFDIGENGWWEPRQFPSGKIFDVVPLEGNSFAISHEDGIYAYTYSPNYLNLIKTGVVYQDLSFDEDHGTLLAATGNLLEEMTLNGQTINQISVSDSIVSFDIHYTR